MKIQNGIAAGLAVLFLSVLTPSQVNAVGQPLVLGIGNIDGYPAVAFRLYRYLQQHPIRVNGQPVGVRVVTDPGSAATVLSGSLKVTVSSGTQKSTMGFLTMPIWFPLMFVAGATVGPTLGGGVPTSIACVTSVGTVCEKYEMSISGDFVLRERNGREQDFHVEASESKRLMKSATWEKLSGDVYDSAWLAVVQHLTTILAEAHE